MFKWITEILHSPGLIEQAENIVSDMLEISYNMFQYSMRIVIEKEKLRKKRMGKRLNKRKKMMNPLRYH